MLRLENICFKRNEKQILKNVCLEINDDSFIAITGPNGSGKSTLAKIIMGITSPDSGKVIFNGEDITNLTIDERAKKGIAFAFQQPIKFKGLTVYDLLKISANEPISKLTACETLSTVGLCAEEYLNRELDSNLSGGELKRIEIATIILRKSSLSIFDEPEAGIDLWSFNNLIEIFRSIRSSIGGTTLVITHQERILNISDTTILLKDGTVSYIERNNGLENIYNVCKCASKKGCVSDECEN